MDEQQLITLARECGTPVYIYDGDAICQRIAEIKALSYAPTEIFAATMANAHPELLKMYRESGLGAFVNSIKHLRVCQEAGFSDKEIIWTSTGMNRRQMEAAIQSNVIINLDSLTQMSLYGMVSNGKSAGLRVNIGDLPNNESYAGVFVGEKSRIGVVPEEFSRVIEIAGHFGVSINGLHTYLGTQIKDVAHFKKGAQMLAEHLKLFSNLEYLDFGGGFAVPEGDEENSFDFNAYGREISNLMEEVSSNYGRRLKLFLEPGRVIAGDSGYFVTAVTDVKLREKHKWVFVDGSSAIFPRPLMYPELANHPHYVLGHKGSAKLSGVTIAGSTTYSRDFLARSSNEIPEDICIGDLIVFQKAGSYSASSQSDFLGIERPAEVLVRDGEYRVITSGERY
ncbi:MAG: hypothetical protein WCV90_08615 [Candidatus Woesearchaeota archaeon]